MAKDTLGMTANILAGVGALNWGLVEFADGLNLVTKLVEVVPIPNIAKILYGAIAASGIYVLVKVLGK